MYDISTLTTDIANKQLHLNSLITMKKEDKLKEIVPWTKDTIEMISSILKGFEKEGEPDTVISLAGIDACHAAKLEINKVISISADILVELSRSFPGDPYSEYKLADAFLTNHLRRISVEIGKKESALFGVLESADLARIDDSDNESYAGIVKKTSKKAKGKKKANKPEKVTIRPLAQTSVDVNADAEEIFSSLVEVEEEENWRFARRRYQQGWFHTPGESRPMLKGKFVKLSTLSADDKKKVTWEPYIPATYYRYRDFSPEALRECWREGYIPKVVLDDAILQSIANPDATNEPRGLDEPTAEKELSHAHVTTARIVSWWGRIERQLRKADLAEKVPFVDKWMVRLLELDPTLDAGKVHVAEKLFHIIRHAGSEKVKVNKAFRSFTMAMLASWRKGQARASFLESARKSVNCFWGPYASNYKDYWCAQPWNDYKTRPAESNMIQKLFRRVQKSSDTIVKSASSAVNTVSQMADETVAEVTNAAEDIARATEDMSTYKKAKAYAVAAKVSFWEALKRVGGYSKKSIRGPNGEVIATRSYLSAVGNILTITLGFPFYSATVEKVVDETTGKTYNVGEVTPRRWWASFLLAIKNFGAPDAESDADASDTIGPFRWAIKSWSGAWSAVRFGVPRAYYRLKGWLTSDADASAKADSLPRPAWRRFGEGFTGHFFYTAAAVGTILHTAVSPVTGAIAFFTGFVGAELAIKKARKFFFGPKELMAAERQPTKPAGELPQPPVASTSTLPRVPSTESIFVGPAPEGGSDDEEEGEED